jgi:hypothetical protein
LLSVPYSLYSVKAADVADNSITSAKIANGTIISDDIATGAVTTAEIKDGTILANDIGTGSITTAEILNGTILTEDLATGSVTTTTIKNGTILADDIGTGSVTTAEILNGTILAEDLATASVTSAEIADGSVTASKISSTGATTDKVLQFNGSSVIWDYAPGSLIKWASYAVPTISKATFGSTFEKMGNLATFTKVDAASTIEITFNGRIHIATAESSGAIFEIRIDDAASTLGRVKASIKSTQTGSTGLLVSVTGFFSNLGTGSHTISMWVRATASTGTGAIVNDGNWETDHLVVKEIK